MTAPLGGTPSEDGEFGVGSTPETLRHWLRQAHHTTPSAAQLQALLLQLDACRTRGHQIHLKAGRGMVVRDGDGLRWYNP